MYEYIMFACIFIHVYIISDIKSMIICVCYRSDRYDNYTMSLQQINLSSKKKNTCKERFGRCDCVTLACQIGEM